MIEEHDEIERLLRESGPRPQPPGELLQRARSDGRKAWQETVAGHRTRRRQRFGMSAAAAMLLALALGSYVSNEQGFEVEIVQATNLLLDGELRAPGPITLESGSLMASARPARLVTASNVDLRFKADTRVSWLAPDLVYLEAGALYVDTHGTAAFRVDTSEGRIRDIGTRFLVAIDAQGVNLAVREGEAEVATGSQSVIVRGDGVKAEVATFSQGNVVVTDESASNDRWAWIQEVAPNYPDVTVRELLDHVCADLGKRLIFESPGVEAATVNLRMTTGSLTRDDPALALKALVRSSGLQLIESNDEVRIGF